MILSIQGHCDLPKARDESGEKRFVKSPI